MKEETVSTTSPGHPVAEAPGDSATETGTDGLRAEALPSRVGGGSRVELGRKVLRQAGVLPALALVFLVGAIFVPGFLAGSNLLDTVQTGSVIGLLAIGQGFVIIAGGAGIDLSVGATLALSSVVGAHFLGSGPVAIIIATLATGLFMGLVNGTGVAITGMQPFIMTLATLTIARGAANYISNANPTTLTGSAALHWLSDSILGVPVPIIVFVVAALIGQLVLGRTIWGKQLYVMGGNEEAARFAGIPVARRRMLVYIISGLCAGGAALLLMSRLGTADPNFASGYELASIAAVVVGGAPLTGGQGSIIGAAAGVLIIQLITDILGLLSVNPFIQQIVTGLIVIVVVGLNRRGRESGLRDLVRAVPLAVLLVVAFILMFTVLSSGVGTQQ
jgi:ribose transport system permease protein